MSSLIWYARYFRDYADKTAHLSLAEHGAYSLLLDHYFAKGGPIAPAIASAIDLLSVCYRVCRAQTDEERAAVRSVVEQFFQVGSDGALHNSRADEELEHAKKISETKALAGKAGVEKRWAKSRAIAHAIAPAIADGLANPIANGLQTDTHPHPQPQVVTNVTTKLEGAKRAQPIPHEFAPSNSHKELAAELQVNLATELDQFRDHHTAKGSAMKDWDAAFRTWLRNAARFKTATKPTRPPALAINRDFSKVDYWKGALPDDAF